MAYISDKILCCPDCGGEMQDRDEAMSCAACSRKFIKYRVKDKSVPVLLSSKSSIKFSEEGGQYGIKENKSLLHRLAVALLPPEPNRFYGDLQFKYKIKNYHIGLHDFIKQAKAKPGSMIFDLGGGYRRLGDGIINIDLFVSSEVDILADANFLPVKDGCADGIVLQTVLEHIDTYDGVLVQAYRVLKEGGILFCEVPFFYPIHSEKDFIRLTPKMLTFMLQRIGFDIEECRSSTGPFSALSISLRTILAVILSFGYKKLFAFWYILIGWLTFWIKYLDMICPPTPMLEYIVPTFYVIAKKKRH